MYIILYTYSSYIQNIDPRFSVSQARAISHPKTLNQGFILWYIRTVSVLYTIYSMLVD